MKKYAYRRVISHGHPRADYLGHVLEHVLVAERAIGKPLPAGAEVHHVDENPAHNVGRNLVICQDRAYHKLLHMRMRIVRAGGNPDTQRICSTCKAMKALSDFNRRQTQCRACAKAYNRTYVRPSKRVA